MPTEFAIETFILVIKAFAGALFNKSMGLFNIKVNPHAGLHLHRCVWCSDVKGVQIAGIMAIWSVSGTFLRSKNQGKQCSDNEV